ncbi:DUF4259 domain-containing protein [Embleya scabrispora]|uniref:DUF4259 domain-containing protein n=1 Tax=Embleya scabrispora TaxID=159449 RepID=UPI000363AF5B|nr:DUF4259 domain-containing protein [Embleya scabrispora]MYS81394.1 DUF4259 domain-containing protein [Streptomyces sp. SID5474]
MGSWGVGPFDNDMATDFVRDLDNSPGSERIVMIERALEASADPSEGFLDHDEAAVAVAAAAIIAASLPGGTPFQVAFEPGSLTGEGLESIPTTVPQLAARALERVIAEDSELDTLWAETNEHEAWRTSVRMLRDSLTEAANEGA